MVYQGSKNRISKFLVPIIQKYIDDNNIKTYIEPMVGGANIIDKIVCENKVGGDINSELIALLQYIQTDNEISIAPEMCTFEHYADVRENRRLHTNKYSMKYTALIGYCASYGGRYFDGGFARNSRTDDRNSSTIKYRNNLKNLKSQAFHLKDITFMCCDYKKFADCKDCLFYFDPPYKGTKQYSIQNINYDEFYDFLRQLSKNNIVLVSEYNMPNDFKCIWQRERNVQQKSDRVAAEKATEKLFIYNG